MWAAANPEQFEAARAAGDARTVRGIHAKRDRLTDAYAPVREAAKERQKDAGGDRKSNEYIGSLKEQIPEPITPKPAPQTRDIRAKAMSAGSREGTAERRGRGPKEQGIRRIACGTNSTSDRTRPEDPRHSRAPVRESAKERQREYHGNQYSAPVDGLVEQIPQVQNAEPPAPKTRDVRAKAAGRTCYPPRAPRR